MRYVFAVVAALLLAFPGVASAARDFAKGSGTSATTNDFRFSARSGPLGQQPAGAMFVDGPSFSVHARVTCLAVDGNMATLIGRRTGGTGAPLATGVAFFVVDASPDRFSFQFVTPTQPEPPCVAFGSITPITAGEIVVHDE